MQLKQYQTDTLSTLRRFLEEARIAGAKNAYESIAQEPEQAARSYGGRYEPLAKLPNVPYVCLRLPTGGGKTILAAHAVSVARDTWIEKDYPLVLWLVPTNTIRRQTAEALKNPRHAYRRVLDDAFAGRVRVFAIATGDQRELDSIDLFDHTCPIEYVITIEALKEGWDCSFAYIFCSVSRIQSATDVEQLLGRVLRMPYAKRRQAPDLNKAYAFLSEPSFGEAARALADKLVDMGFEEDEVRDNIEPVQQTLDLQSDLFEPREKPEPVFRYTTPATLRTTCTGINRCYRGHWKPRKHFLGPARVPAFDGADDGEEMQCAQVIDSLAAVKYWIRNVARHPNSFWLPTATDKFYPDFVALLTDGRLLVVEYKGAHIAEGSDTNEKRTIGTLWERESNGKGLFAVAEKMVDGKDLRQQFTEKIRI